MRTLLMVLLLLFPIQALASEDCFVVDNKKYCRELDKPDINLGGVEVQVVDPAELLRKARETRAKLKRTGLYDDYHYLPVIEELAKQNDMTYYQFTSYMIWNWQSIERNPFVTIREFEMVYDNIPVEYKDIVITNIAFQISYEVEMAILKAFRFAGVEA